MPYNRRTSAWALFWAPAHQDDQLRNGQSGKAWSPGPEYWATWTKHIVKKATLRTQASKYFAFALFNRSLQYSDRFGTNLSLILGAAFAPLPDAWAA